MGAVVTALGNLRYRVRSPGGNELSVVVGMGDATRFAAACVRRDLHIIGVAVCDDPPAEDLEAQLDLVAERGVPAEVPTC